MSGTATIAMGVTLRDKSTKEGIQQASAGEILSWLLILYRRQTLSERQDGSSQEQNGEGFSKFDAPILTSISVWGQAHGFLTPKQAGVVRRRLRKYVRQLNSCGDAESTHDV